MRCGHPAWVLGELAACCISLPARHVCVCLCCRYSQLSETLKSKRTEPGAKRHLLDELDHCHLQWAIALRIGGDARTAAGILSHLHQSMKGRLPRWHNKLLELEKELELNVAMHTC